MEKPGAPPQLLTSRLLLRRRTLADLHANLAMDLDPQVYTNYDIHFNARNGAANPRALRKAIKSEIASGARGGRAVWVVQWRDQSGFLGLIELFAWTAPLSTAISFRFIKSAWGQGIATEAAAAVLDFGFRVMKLPTIIALVHPENRASQRVVTKVGMRLDGEVHLSQKSASKFIVYRRNHPNIAALQSPESITAKRP